MWLKEMFGTDKPIIAMLHLKGLPTDPRYNKEKGLEYVIECAEKDLQALQNGGVDGILFSNEFSLPYQTKVSPITVASMAYIIGCLKDKIRIPFGVQVIFDSYMCYDLAVATGAKFVRSMFTGAIGWDYGITQNDPAEIMRHQYSIGADNVRSLHIIKPEGGDFVVKRPLDEIATSVIFNCNPDAILVGGVMAGAETDDQELVKVRKAIEGLDIPLFANTGVRYENVERQLAIADGAVVGTSFKKDGNFNNEVDFERVKQFMDKVKALR